MPPVPLADRPSLWAPLAHREFALLWGGYVVSHVGDAVQMHAQAWLVTDLSRSALKLGGVALAQAVPRLLFGLFAGVVVDRVDRRALLIVTQALAMAQSAVFLALLLAGQITYGRVVALAALLGVFDTLNLTARVAMMPSLVPRALIGRTVALQALGVNAVQIAAPAIAGVLIAQTGVRGCLIFNLATFAVLLGALALMRPSPRAAGGATAVGRALGEGFAFVRARPLLWGSVALAYLVGFFGVSFVRLLALYARGVLGTTPRGYGVLGLATGVGAVLASAVVTARAQAPQLPRNIVGGALLFAGALAALGSARSFVAAFGALCALGFGQMAFRSAITTSIQLETPDRLRGRVISLLTLDFSLWSLGALAAGAAADAFARWAPAGHEPTAWSISVTLLCMGGVCAAATLALARTILGARLGTASAPREDEGARG